MTTRKQSHIINMVKTVTHVMGMLLTMEGLFMFVCILPSLIANEQSALMTVLKSSAITLFSGAILWLPFRKRPLMVYKREGLLIVTLIWVVFSFFGSLPLYLGGYVQSFVDAYFETVSGFTTTGATVLQDVEILPYSIGLWRIMTHWIGGIGIIVIMLSVIPFSGGGGMALFSAEVAGPVKSKIAPRIKETSMVLMIVYVSLTVIYCLTYWLLGMNFYDAVCHAFTTVATGGLSTKNLSAAAFSPAVHYCMSAFMILSGVNLLVIYYIVRGKFSLLKDNEEFRVYIALLLISTIIIFLLTYTMDKGVETTFRNALFMVSAITTSTGLINCDYQLFPLPALMILLMLMMCGAMSGSTTGGLKIIRMMILFKNARNSISKGLHSNAFMPVTVNGKILPEDTLLNVFHVFMLYILTLVAGFLVFVATGLPMDEALVSGISALSNMGPAYGQSIMGNFAHFNDIAKVTMVFLMIAGRLELVTVFAVFSRAFRKI